MNATIDTVMDAVSAIQEFLRVQAAFLGPHNEPINGYTSLSDLILRNGRAFTETAHCKRGRMRECFRNAANMALRDRDMIYCEGYGTTTKVPFPLQHAWCVTRDGVVHDPTWKDGHGYFGIPFKRRYLFRALNKQKVYGLIEVPDLPLLKLDETIWKETL